MAFGLQIWDAAGNLQLDLSMRVSRILGFVDSGTTGGSVVVPGFLDGDPWFFTAPLAGTLDQWLSPNITIAGDTLSWFWIGAEAGMENSHRIWYGIY